MITFEKSAIYWIVWESAYLLNINELPMMYVPMTEWDSENDFALFDFFRKICVSDHSGPFDNNQSNRFLVEC